MTVPIQPVPGWGLAQGIGQALQVYAQERQRREEEQRRNAMQGLALFQQILPSLTQYQPPQTTANFAPNLMEGAQGIQVGQTPEKFNTPKPPPLIQNYLQQLTGQNQLGLSPEQMDAMRKNYYAGKTAPILAQQSAAELGQTRATTKLTEARLPQVAAETAGQLSQNKILDYKAGTQPTVDALGYVDQYAPGAVLQVASDLNIPVNKKNASLIAQKAYDRFKTEQGTNPLAQYVTPAMFGKAIQEQIDFAEKLGLERLRAQADMIQANRMNNPLQFWQAAVDNEQNAVNSLQREQQALQGVFKNPQIMMYAMSAKDLDDPGLALTPEQKAAILRLRSIPTEVSAHAARRDQIQTRLNDATGLKLESAPTGTAAPAAPGQSTPNAFRSRQEVSSVLKTSTSRTMQRAAFLTMLRNKLINPADAQQIMRENDITGVSQQDIEAALRGGQP
jgi:hypothetical protein